MTTYALVPVAVLEQLRPHLPISLQYELDTSTHVTTARPADDLRADPEKAARLAVMLRPTAPLGIQRLRDLGDTAYLPLSAVPLEQRQTLELVRRAPRGAIANLLLYADAGAPPLSKR